MEGQIQVCVTGERLASVLLQTVLFSDLNTQWTQKVKIIDSLEENLQQLQKTFQEKENQLVQERDEALHSAR